MKNTILIVSVLSLLFFSCELDNYDGPTAGISGSFIDSQTGALVEQDLINGSVISLAEHGYDPVGIQYLAIKNDGTYQNSLLFENTYTVQPVRGNFYPVDPQEVAIGPNTILDFTVTPYLRIENPAITYENGKVTASFSIDQTGSSNVLRVGLFAHPNSVVGHPVQLFSVEEDLNRDVARNEVFTLEIDISGNSTVFDRADDFFFRIGAISNAAEAKYNYAPATRITL